MEGRSNFWVQLHALADTIQRQGGASECSNRCMDQDFRRLTPEAQREARDAIDTVHACAAMLRTTLRLRSASAEPATEAIESRKAS
jgi:hypothetical protein